MSEVASPSVPTIDDLLSQENVRLALEHFSDKRDGAGPDGMRISQLPRYWKANHHLIEQQIREGSYQFGVVRRYEVITPRGKRRLICSIDAVDRLVERMLHQVLLPLYEPRFSDRSFGYRVGRGTLDAAQCARTYVANGYSFLCEVDLKDYFNWIPHEPLMELLSKDIKDPAILTLLRGVLTRSVMTQGKLEQQTCGVLQGAGVSPLLANVYLDSLDHLLDHDGWHWLRFADNIYVYTTSEDEALACLERLVVLLEENYHLRVNSRKAGVYDAFSRTLLGYDIRRGKDGNVLAVRHEWRQHNTYPDWHKSALTQNTPGEFHLVGDGILTREDFSLLFEGPDLRQHIPVETTEQLSVYGNVMVTPPALAALNAHDIRVCYVDKYGELIGTYVPSQHQTGSVAFLGQCRLYLDQQQRVLVARRMEIAGMHNMRTNLRYYHSKLRVGGLDLAAEDISQLIVKANEACTVDALMLLEAQARRTYFACFPQMLLGVDFDFQRRTRRPPRDPINALISFGNTLLYNRFLKLIWKKALDPRVGVIHATNGRHYSLNLDLADIFKPVIVDHVIFYLVNRGQLVVTQHFVKEQNGAVLLNSEGKRIFIKAFEKKLTSEHLVGKEKVSYAKLMEQEVEAFKSLVVSGVEYKPYKSG